MLFLLLRSSSRLFFLLPIAAALLCACARPAAPPPRAAVTPPHEFSSAANDTAPTPLTPLRRIGYTIQVGAFSRLDNAVRLERSLERQGIDAFYFRHESGLYKVRFGDHADYRSARSEAERLQAQGVIDAFFIVQPEDYAIARNGAGDRTALREELVATARRFLGVPYRWGGSDQESGFDCSGLTMVCYRLNGLDLPRISREQYAAGRKVDKGKLERGDLVFFATAGGDRVSHVGIYIGQGLFIHAPRRGQEVRIEQLSHPFYDRTFRGGRNYL